MTRTSIFEMLADDRALDRAIARELERTMGVEDFELDFARRRICISYNAALTDDTALGELLAACGCRVRPGGRVVH